jgi:hypothetical protein
MIPGVVSSGCAAQGPSGLGETCWSKCDPETSRREFTQWNEGDPWCWLKGDTFIQGCDDANDCPALLECLPDFWENGGCSVDH